MNPSSIISRLLVHDKFSQWLGIEVMEVSEGSCKIKMTLRDEMVNGFGVMHGGIIFSFADSALAFACNSRNNLSLALDASINFTKSCKPGDTLIAETKEVHNGKSTGVYLITVNNQNNEHVALFKGTCFRTGKKLLEP